MSVAPPLAFVVVIVERFMLLFSISSVCGLLEAVACNVSVTWEVRCIVVEYLGEGIAGGNRVGCWLS